MPTNWEKLGRCVAAGAENTETVFKVVVFDDADYAYAREVAERFPEVPMYLQVGNDNPPGADPAASTRAGRARATGSVRVALREGPRRWLKPSDRTPPATRPGPRQQTRRVGQRTRSRPDEPLPDARRRGRHKPLGTTLSWASHEWVTRRDRGTRRLVLLSTSALETSLPAGALSPAVGADPFPLQRRHGRGRHLHLPFRGLLACYG